MCLLILYYKPPPQWKMAKGSSALNRPLRTQLPSGKIMTIYVKSSVCRQNKCVVLPLRLGKETNAYITGPPCTHTPWSHDTSTWVQPNCNLQKDNCGERVKKRCKHIRIKIYERYPIPRKAFTYFQFYNNIYSRCAGHFTLSFHAK